MQILAFTITLSTPCFFSGWRTKEKHVFIETVLGAFIFSRCRLLSAALSMARKLVSSAAF
jgi:hypothetical protein